MQLCPDSTFSNAMRRQLVKHARVGALPLSLFYCDTTPTPPPTHLVRFSVCKVRGVAAKRCKCQ